MSTQRPFVPSPERLESRIAPAGLVQADYDRTTRTLILTGDGLDNLLHVTQTASNRFVVEGLEGTAIGETGSETWIVEEAVKRIVVDAGGGGDAVHLNLINLESLEVSAGGGSDLVRFTDLKAVGVVQVHLGEGTDQLVIEGNDFNAGDLFISATAGTNSIANTAENFIVKGRMLIQGSTGADSFTSTGERFQVGAGFGFFGGGEADLLNILASKQVMLGKTPANDVHTAGASLEVVGGSSMAVSLSSADLLLSGFVSYTGSTGADRLSLQGDKVRILGRSPLGESIILQDPAGTTELGLAGKMIQVAGGLKITGGAAGGTVELGEGATSLGVGKLKTGNSVEFTGGAGSDVLTISAARAQFLGGMQLSLGNGTNIVQLGAAGAQLTLGNTVGMGSLQYAGGTGGDVMTLTGAKVLLVGGISASLGAGNNSFSLNSGTAGGTVGRLASGLSLEISGGTGADVVSILGPKVSLVGGLALELGNGVNGLDFSGAGSSIRVGQTQGVSLAYVAGADADILLADAKALALAGSLEVVPGGGEIGLAWESTGTISLGRSAKTGNSLTMAAGAGVWSAEVTASQFTAAGALFLQGGTGAEILEINAWRASIGRDAMGNSLTLGGGAGADSITLQGDLLRLTGQLYFEGGGGRDSLSLAGEQSFSLGGLTVYGDADADTVSVLGIGTIAGYLMVDLGESTSGTQSFSLRGASVNAMRVAKGFTVVSAASAADTMTAINVMVRGAFDLGTGGGNSTVTLDNLSAFGDFVVNSNAGTDTINFERGDMLGVSSLMRSAVFNLGGGSDVLRVGELASAEMNHVRFLGFVTIPLGSGDSLNDDFRTANEFKRDPDVY